MTATPPLLRDMIAELIAIPSVSSVEPEWDQGNLQVVERLASWLEPMGFACEIRPVPGPDGTPRPDKANLIATLGRGEGGLVLAGHTDTVPYDPALWSHNPFELTEADGRLYGLGTTDMKSFLALATEAARGLSAQDLSAPLTLLATADEESGMDGARALAAAGRASGLGARFAVIGEPTANRPVHLHKGMMMEAIRVVGRSGHSSDPSLGHNALDDMTGLLDELIQWRRQLAERYRDSRFAVPQPTLNLGHIHGGDNPNRICGQVELHIDLRPLPGMSMEELRAELAGRLRERMDRSPGQLELRSLFPGHPPMATDAGAEIVRVAERLTGSEAGAVAFGTEGPYLSQMGMDVLILGPGDIGCAHQPDEFLRVDRIEPTVELLRQFIDHFCRQGSRDAPGRP